MCKFYNLLRVGSPWRLTSWYFAQQTSSGWSRSWFVIVQLHLDTLHPLSINQYIYGDEIDRYTRQCEYSLRKISCEAVTDIFLTLKLTTNSKSFLVALCVLCCLCCVCHPAITRPVVRGCYYHLNLSVLLYLSGWGACCVDTQASVTLLLSLVECLSQCSKFIPLFIWYCILADKMLETFSQSMTDP